MSTTQTVTEPITCTTKLFTIGNNLIVRLPEDASAKLPSRGQVMVEGTMNDVPFALPLEPDGKWSHYVKVPADLQAATASKAGDEVTLVITPTKKWPEPEIPSDFQKAIDADAEVHDLWQRITPLARWEWIRWTRATDKAETRAHRIEVACDKMRHGERRPCCWNRNLSTEPDVSKSGILLATE